MGHFYSVWPYFIFLVLAGHVLSHTVEILKQADLALPSNAQNAFIFSAFQSRTAYGCNMLLNAEQCGPLGSMRHPFWVHRARSVSWAQSRHSHEHCTAAEPNLASVLECKMAAEPFPVEVLQRSHRNRWSQSEGRWERKREWFYDVHQKHHLLAWGCTLVHLLGDTGDKSPEETWRSVSLMPASKHILVPILLVCRTLPWLQS